jgi:hypothetical protein
LLSTNGIILKSVKVVVIITDFKKRFVEIVKRMFVVLASTNVNTVGNVGKLNQKLFKKQLKQSLVIIYK